MSGYGRIGLKDAIPAAVSGHEVDGAPAVAAHLAVVPLANLGWTYSDGALFGFALVPPRAEPGRGLLEDPNFQRAIRAVLLDGVLPLNGTGVELKPIVEAARASLDPLRYRGPARTWATATPIVLDRHLKTDPAKDGPEARQEEIADVIARACTNIGLPPPAVVPDKHSAIEGAPSAYPSGRAPAWTGWRVPEPQRSRALSHAVIRFAEPVEGPVILGSGRFSGLGICLPLDAEARR
jgi:CRISPR-associated protein Csb2